jgi:uncharacterized protein YggU (UPF0235/DUF167 family)
LSSRSPFSAASNHLTIAARLTPKANANRIDGRQNLADGNQILTARVTAPPDSGKANAALIKLVATALGVPASTVSVASGHKARLKQLRVAGDPAALLDLAERLWPSLADTKGGTR